jgi:hypothetical protein
MYEEHSKYGLMTEGSQFDPWKWKSIYLLLLSQAYAGDHPTVLPSISPAINLSTGFVSYRRTEAVDRYLLNRSAYPHGLKYK